MRSGTAAGTARHRARHRAPSDTAAGTARHRAPSGRHRAALASPGGTSVRAKGTGGRRGTALLPSPYFPPFPLPGEGQTAGAYRLPKGQRWHRFSAAGEWGPRPRGHPHSPGTGSPSLPGQTLPFSPFPVSRRDSPTRRRLAGGGRAGAGRTAGRGAAAWLGWDTGTRSGWSGRSGLCPSPAAATALIGPAQRKGGGAGLPPPSRECPAPEPAPATLWGDGRATAGGHGSGTRCARLGTPHCHSHCAMGSERDKGNRGTGRKRGRKREGKARRKGSREKERMGKGRGRESEIGR